jgi:hypothetical protein
VSPHSHAFSGFPRCDPAHISARRRAILIDQNTGEPL